MSALPPHPVRTSRGAGGSIVVKAVGLADNRDVRRQQSLPDVVGACMPSDARVRCAPHAVVPAEQHLRGRL